MTRDELYEHVLEEYHNIVNAHGPMDVVLRMEYEGIDRSTAEYEIELWNVLDYLAYLHEFPEASGDEIQSMLVNLYDTADAAYRRRLEQRKIKETT